MSYQKMQDNYLKNQVLTATPNQLIEMLLEGAIKNIRVGLFALENEQFAKAGQHFIKAQDIVSELRYSVNTEVESEIPDNLIQLYDFMYDQLVLGNIDRDVEVITNVQNMLADLLETWKQIAE